MKNILTFCLLFIGLFTAHSQSGVKLDALTNNRTIDTCGTAFYDDGDATGNYSASQTRTITFRPNGAAAVDNSIKITISQIDLAPGAQLCFFDGTTTAAPSLGCITSANQFSRSPWVIAATRQNPSRAVTIQFTAPAGATAAGWAAFVTCDFSCQPITAQIYESTPAIMPIDTGYIDACIGQQITLKARGIYPQNGVNYTQNDTLSSFEWNLGEVNSAIVYGPVINKVYTRSGFYNIQLTIIDTTGKCRNTNFINQRVRIAPEPFFRSQPIRDSLCVGDTLSLRANVVSDTARCQNLELCGSSGVITSSIGRTRSDSICLPDGGGRAYSGIIRFQEFLPGAILSDVNDLNYIFINIEHTYMFDNDIRLTCPNGQSIALHRFITQRGPEVFLGNADDGTTVTTGCPAFQGYGWEYRWTPQATRSWVQTVDAAPTGTVSMMIGAPAGIRRVLPPSARPVNPNIVLPDRRAAWVDFTGALQDYKPDDALTGLIGCPLNGEWTLTFRDLFGSDDGRLFAWGLSLNRRLYRNIETFSPRITEHGWTDNPFIAVNNRDSIIVRPNSSGNASFIYRIKDQFGCDYSRSYNVNVRPITHPSCASCAVLAAAAARPADTTICLNDTASINATAVNTVRSITFESFPYKLLKRSQFPAAAPFRDTIRVNSIRPLTIVNALTQIDSVCFDLGANFPLYDEVALVAPNGQSVRLLAANAAGFGNNVRNICFTPQATQTVTSALLASGTRVFAPVDPWTGFNGSATAGNWYLRAHITTGAATDTLNRWSITLKNINTVNYTWSSATDPFAATATTGNPRFSPTVTSSYIVNGRDDFGCTFRDTVVVGIKDSLPAPVVFSSGQPLAVTFTWSPIAGATGYQVSIDGGVTWITPNNGATSHIVSRPGPTTPVRIMVRGIPNGSFCGARITTLNRADNCDFDLQLGTVDAILCYGGTGRVNLSSFSATQPTTYYVLTQPAGDTIRRQLQNPLMENLVAGSYKAIGIDGAGCRDTVLFTLTQPTPIRDSFRVDSVLCNGSATGQIRALASGGTVGAGGYSFVWSNGEATQTITGLAAGRYWVDIIDDNGCTKRDTVFVFEPTALSTTTSFDSVRCFGNSTGRARVRASGGIMPYRYNWNTTPPSIIDSISNISAGSYTVTVTDAKNCTQIATINVAGYDTLRFTFSATTNATCGAANGRATVNNTGGRSPYRYSWDSGETTATAVALTAGMHRVTVTDGNNCTNVDSVRINTPNGILSTSSQTTTLCYGDSTGRASVTASGGSGGFTYRWDNNPLLNTATVIVRAGLHRVAITDASGCIKLDSVTVLQPDSVKIDSLRSTPASCNAFTDGTTRIVSSGGTGALTYLWTPSNQTTQTATALVAGLYNVRVRDANGCTKTDTIRVNQPTVLAVALRADSARCYGSANGTARVTPTGGNGGYTYRWNTGATTDSISGLVIGRYTVVVTDSKNCTKTDSVRVYQPDSIRITFNRQNVTCFGLSNGVIQANVSGGISNYSYLWDNGDRTSTATAFSAGLHSVTVTDRNGCTMTDTARITSPNAILSTSSQTTTLCYGDSTGRASVTASGGSGSFTYRWDNNPLLNTATVIVRAGLHRVAITDGSGCIKLDSVTVLQPDSVKIDSLRSTPASCNAFTDGTTRIVSSGGTGALTYLWTPSNQTTQTATALVAGLYNVRVRDANGCTKTDTIRVNQPTVLAVALRADSARCYGSANGTARVTPTGGNGGYTYRWNTGATTDSISGLVIGRYTVVVTDSKNCTKTDSVRVSQPDSIRITFNRQNATCFGVNNGVIQANVSGGIINYSYLWDNGDRTATATAFSAGLHSVTVTDRNGCTMTDTARITSPNAILSTTSGTNNRCYGDSTGIARVVASGGTSPYTYLWNSNSRLTTANVGVRAGVQTVEIRDALGCIKRDTVTLTQPDSIKVDSAISTPALCNSSPTGTLRLVVSGGTGAYTYSWSPGGQTTSRITGLVPNLYTYTIRDANTCVKTDTVRVRATAPLVVDSIRTNLALCNGQASGSARIFMSGGAGGYTYLWSTGSRFDSVQNVRAGNYTVVVTDANGCTLTDTAKVLQPSRMQIVLTPQAARCKFEGSGRITPTVAGGTPRSSGTAYTYAWNDNTGQTDSVAINLRAGAYVVSVTDANGCIDSARTVVGEPASGVQAAAVQTFTGCFGTATGRATVTAQGGTQPYTYSWSSGSILQEARDLLGIPYTVTVTDQNGCSFLDTVDVQTLDSISIYQSAIKPSCFGFSNGTITIDSVLGGAGNNVLRNYNFRWSSTPVQTTPQATGLLGGRAYTVTVTDGNGCFNYTSMVLDQPGQILVATTPTNNKCFGDTTGIAQVNAQGSINVFTYQWSANVPNDRTLPRVTGLTAGIYTVTVTDSTGCTANTSVTVTQPSRLRLVDKISDNNKCFGDSVGSAQIRMAGGTPQYKYIWSTAAPRLDTLPTIAGLKAGTYTITVSDINGCRFIDTVGLREPNLLAGNITTQPVKCFAGRDGSISINPLGGTPPYVFSTDNRLFTGTNNLVGLRSATYDLYVKDANNCLWFSRASVGTPTQFTVNAGPDVTIRLGESTQLTATPSNNQGRTSFIWRAPYDSTLSCTRCATPVSKPFFTINYVVTATDTTGCIATDEVQVTVLKNGEIFIPTGFSPNADGANDKLRVRGKEGIKIKSYKIYDRWGELIYEARNFMINDENAAWDGTFRGQPMNQGAFVWFVEAQFIDGSVETFKGNTTLLR